MGFWKALMNSIFCNPGTVWEFNLIFWRGSSDILLRNLKSLSQLEGADLPLPVPSYHRQMGLGFRKGRMNKSRPERENGDRRKIWWQNHVEKHELWDLHIYLLHARSLIFSSQATILPTQSEILCPSVMWKLSQKWYDVCGEMEVSQWGGQLIFVLAPIRKQFCLL